MTHRGCAVGLVVAQHRAQLPSAVNQEPPWLLPHVLGHAAKRHTWQARGRDLGRRAPDGPESDGSLLAAHC
jgi:hypothetical protein